MQYHKRYRRGHAAVEFALIAPLAFTMVLGPMIGALWIFQYQQVGYLAQEAARWASVHGTKYAQATGKPAAQATDVYQQVIAPRSATLNLGNLTYSVTWNTSNSPTRTVIVSGQTQTIANTVTVTINYKWLPQLTTNTLMGTSTATMSY